MSITSDHRLAFRVALGVVLCHGFALAELGPRSMASAEDAAQREARVAAQLRAGEFGPALVLAEEAGTGEVRDRLLAEIAREQARSGARGAARRTLSSISDDQTLAKAAAEVAGVTAAARGNPGGGTQADFDALIDLITRTVAPQTWDAVGGPGAISEFPGGVFVDAAGLLARLPIEPGDPSLEALRSQALAAAGPPDADRVSPLRKVSLTRLERHLQLRWAMGELPTEAMRCLAGLTRLQYVFVYPETGDIVLAGPAGPWTRDAEGRAVRRDSGQPVLQLDDLIVLLRNAWELGGRFSCSINPRRENLAATRRLLDGGEQRELRAGERNGLSDRLRETLGVQDIEVTGIDPRTRVARVIVEADYRMKLVGMGLEEGCLGVESYLDAIDVRPGSPPPATSILRWWFALHYQPLRTTPARDVFAIRGQGARVLSEKALITESGDRQFVGNTDPLAEQFAQRFTAKFDDLAIKYPIYAELRNVFDLTLAATLIVAEDLPGQVDWHAVHFRAPDRCRVALGAAPREVQTVVNQRKIVQDGRKLILTGVSGGVTVDAAPLVAREAIQVDDYGVLDAERGGAVPRVPVAEAWWWD